MFICGRGLVLLRRQCNLSHVLPVLWMTSSWRIIGQAKARSTRYVLKSDSPGVSTGAKWDIYYCLVTAASCWCVSQSVIGTVDEPEDSPDGSSGGIFDLAIPWWWVLLLIILGSLLVILLIIIIIIILWRWSVLTHISIHLYTGWLHRYMSGKPCVCCYSILWNIQYCFWLILANVRFWAPPYITCLFHLSVR